MRSVLKSTSRVLYQYSMICGGVYYSENTLDLLGYTPDFLLQNPKCWHDSIHQNDLEMVDNVLLSIRPGRSYELQYRFRHAEGRWIWLRDSFSATSGDSGEVLVEGVVNDVTTAKIFEAAMAGSPSVKALAEDEISDIVICLDVNREIKWMNMAALRMRSGKTGLFTGIQCSEYWNHTAEDCEKCPMKRTLETGVPHEEEIATSDGTRWLVKASAIRDENDEIVGVVEARHQLNI